MLPKTISNLIELFQDLPGVGPKTAQRYVFNILKKDRQWYRNFLKNLELLKTIGFCENCFNVSEKKICPICASDSRDKSLLCIVERETDIDLIERTKSYNGLYLVLGSLINPLKGKGLNILRKTKLLELLKNNAVKEVILALDFTVTGQATALYLKQLIAPYNKKITRLGRGMPTGSDVGYADEETLKYSLLGRGEF
jgi:recombination protein RecR